MEIAIDFEESSLLIGVTKKLQMKQKNKSGFLSTLLGSLDTSLLENLSTGKGVKAKTSGQGVIRAGKGTTEKAINCEIQTIYQGEPKLEGVYSINNLPKIKNGA